MANNPNISLYGSAFGVYLFLAFVALFVVFLVLYLLERDKNSTALTSAKAMQKTTATGDEASGSSLTLRTALDLDPSTGAAAPPNDTGLVTVELNGGLGNQLFEVAAAYAYGQTHHKTLVMDHSQHKVGNRRTYFDTVYPWVSDYRHLKRKNWRKLAEAHFHYTALPGQFGNVKLAGYFQSLKYFAGVRDEVVRLFKQSTPAIPAEHVTYQRIQQALTPTVSLHIRRSDYVGHSMHPVQPLEYYQRALSAVREQLSHEVKTSEPLTVVVFSDDLPWCQAHLPGAVNNNVVEWVYVEAAGLSDAQEMVLMSECQHHIIANSSFSWWGAVYDLKPNTVVVAPKLWFANTTYNWNDVYCPGWLVV